MVVVVISHTSTLHFSFILDVSTILWHCLTVNSVVSGLLQVVSVS